MTGWGCVNNNDFIIRFFHNIGKCFENGYFLRTWRTQIKYQSLFCSDIFAQSNSVELTTTVTQPASWKITAITGVR